MLVKRERMVCVWVGCVCVCVLSFNRIPSASHGSSFLPSSSSTRVSFVVVVVIVLRTQHILNCHRRPVARRHRLGCRMSRAVCMVAGRMQYTNIWLVACSITSIIIGADGWADTDHTYREVVAKELHD